MRSPELGPTQRSPLNREKVVTEEQPAVAPIVQDVNMVYGLGSSLPSSVATTSNRILPKIDWHALMP